MSERLKCPSCGNAFTWWRKQLLGPARKIKCSTCGAQVSVSKVYVLPVIVLVIFAIWVPQFLLPRIGALHSGAIFLIILLLTMAYHHYFVPLVVRSKTD